MTDFKFTQDWFHWAPEIWTQLTPTLPGRGAFLELGSFEGRSTVWIVENMLGAGGFIDCVDTWMGAEEHIKMGLAMPAAEANFEYNIDKVLGGATVDARGSEGWVHHVRYASEGGDATNKRVYKYRCKSTEMLGSKLCDPQFSRQPLYDFIYVDASHTAPDVLTDACMAWPLLKENGIMVFDDYLWGEQRDVLRRPKLAIDAFANIFAEQLKPLYSGYQYIVRKEK